MKTPESMRAELGAWNNGAGIDLQGWICGTGNFAQAIGYAALLWPEFELMDGYLVRVGTNIENIRSFANRSGITRGSVEAAVNHRHLAHLLYNHEECTADKLLALGKVLKEMYEARLAWQFPDRPCTVELYIPAGNSDQLLDYQITFWQNASDSVPARSETTP